VIPLVYLYPLVTILLALVFLHERLTGVQAVGIALAIVAAILLSQEAAPPDKTLG
jgi:drug/metabolite transporter (DMT)-like permease